MTVAQFPKSKRYSNFGPLLTDVAAKFPDTKTGIIILIDEAGEVVILPVCTVAQLAYAGACLLKEATE